MTRNKPIVVREVWQYNLQQEFYLIHQCMLAYPIIAFDTEFPGTVVRIKPHDGGVGDLSLHLSYNIMKLNVDQLNIIQLGMTLSDTHGNLPDFGDENQYVWQFNFRDFNLYHHPHCPESISLLEKQGINFQMNMSMGIDSRCFAELFLFYGLGRGFNRTWVTFHAQYDFGFLIKILTQMPHLPDELNAFIGLVGFYFGDSVYDLKMAARSVGMQGGLERVAKALNVDRAAGRSHQAGSDSLLIMQSFLKLVSSEDPSKNMIMKRQNYNLYGITLI